MPFGALLGRVVTLAVRRLGPPGAFLAVDRSDVRPDAPTLLLPGREVPEGAAEGDEVEVFVYLDSEDRPIATTTSPKLVLGEVRFLAITDVTRFGAFVDWGLQKDLLVPHAEQTRETRVGDRHPIGLYLDDTERLAGTMRISEMLGDPPDLPLDAWVEGEAWRKEPELGVFVIVQRTFVGLVPASEPTALSRGQAARFRVASVLPDGKIELSLRGHAHEELENDALTILSLLARPGTPRVGDRSSPDQIRAVFGLSKKAFKRGTGRLLKQGAVRIDGDGFLVLATQRIA
jgi:predicted RNA-binding protein (virulence factor B family)